MKVDYEELMQYYETARNKTPGEWKVAIEAILDAVPRIVKEREKLEAENAELAKENSNQKRVIQMLEYRVRELKGKPIPMEPRQFIPSSNRSNAKEAGE